MDAVADRSAFRRAQIERWDGEYSRKGALWRGGARLDFRIIEGARVLELGCGNGKTLSALLRTRCQLTAVDISPVAVELARTLVEQSGRGDVPVLVADACDLGFEDGSFDTILAVHVLEHLLEDDRKKAAVEVARVLVPGGRALVRAFHTGDMRYGKGKSVEEGTFMRGGGIICHYFSEGELAGLFTREAGMKVCRMERVRRPVRYFQKEYVREAIVAEFEKAR